MQNQAHTVIHILPFAERLVPTFMGDDPYACAHSTLRRIHSRAFNKRRCKCMGEGKQHAKRLLG